MSSPDPDYRGRFAPSPTGPLHFGSLIAAVASYLQARINRGSWLLRIEDIDTPRCSSDAATNILNALEHYGLHWDEDVTYQSQRNTRYEHALEHLHDVGLSYDCACSRKEIARVARTGTDGYIYPGTCRTGLPAGKAARTVRVKTDESEIVINDPIQGMITQHILTDAGDFILKRADGLYAYQLAVVVDDAEQQITEVVRGSDIFDLTPRQVWLQQQLGYPTPRYVHTPVAVNNQGQKLSKQTLAEPLSFGDPRPVLIHVLDFLGQQPPLDLRDSNLDSILDWAMHHWSLESVPQQRELEYREYDK